MDIVEKRRTKFKLFVMAVVLALASIAPVVVLAENLLT